MIAAGGGGGACATESVATASERTPSTLPATKLPEIFLRISSPPLSISLSITVRQRHSKVIISVWLGIP
jgi:hypothetical protein